jgi:hypothetical protein
MARKGLSAALALLMLLALPGVSHALTLKQKTLVGLKGLGVIVEDINPEAERLGLTRNQIITDVELRLRKARIKVLTEKERIETQGKPFLYVNVNTNIGNDFCIYGISVKLDEDVTLTNGKIVMGNIWEISSIGGVAIYNINHIRRDVGDLIDHFINDYLAANPR